MSCDDSAPGRFSAREPWLTAASVSRFLRNADLTRWRELVGPARPVLHFQSEQPGEYVQPSIKKPGRIARPSHRVTVNRRDNVDGAGWNRVHMVIGDASHIAKASVATDDTAQTATQLLECTVVRPGATGALKPWTASNRKGVAAGGA